MRAGLGNRGDGGSGEHVGEVITVSDVRTESRVVAYLAIVLGSIAFCVGWSGPNEDPVIQATGAVVVAGLALLGATAGLSTWQEERRRAREQHQRDTYATLVVQLLSRFGASGPYDPTTEANVRAQVATWADVTVVKKLSAWHAVYDRYVPAVAAGLSVTLNSDAKAAFEKATAEVVQAVRKDLSPDDNATVQELIQALFNKPSQA